MSAQLLAVVSAAPPLEVFGEVFGSALAVVLFASLVAVTISFLKRMLDA